MRAVVYIEYPSCKRLNGEVFLRCTSGSKKRGYKKFGIMDDDADFAWRFLVTCKRMRADLCVAVVRDPDVEEWIAKFLNKFRHLKDKVVVFKIPFSSCREQVDRIVALVESEPEDLVSALSRALAEGP